MITTGSDITTTTTSDIPIEEYSPPIKMYWAKNGRIQYIPVKFERKLVKYHITLTQGVYPDGKLGHTYICIEIDNSKNIIKNRYEILDL